MQKRKHSNSDAHDTIHPTNPLPAPNLGDANQMQPSETAQQATWQTYQSSTAHTVPDGQLDEEGIKDVDDNEHPDAPRKRHGDKFPAADHDAKRRDRE